MKSIYLFIIFFIAGTSLLYSQKNDFNDVFQKARILDSLYENNPEKEKEALGLYLKAFDLSKLIKEQEKAYNGYKRVFSRIERREILKRHPHTKPEELSKEELVQVAFEFESTFDKVSAMEYYREAAIKDEPYACNVFGMFCLLSEQYDAAFACFERGAQLGYGPSIYNMAVAYISEIGVFYNKEMAEKYFALYKEWAKYAPLPDYRLTLYVKFMKGAYNKGIGDKYEQEESTVRSGEILEKAIESSANSQAYMQMGDILYKKKDNSAASMNYIQAWYKYGNYRAKRILKIINPKLLE